MNNIYKIILGIVLLTGCRQVVDEGAINTNSTMDEGERQLVMEQEYTYPEQEEGMIPSPSDELHGSEPWIYPVME